ncbi:hypothetical protein K2X85_01340 [bacterium]|nr:hypothetical protein [bacterium]
MRRDWIRRAAFWMAGVCLLVSVVSTTAGCSRRIYRLRADKESDFLIKQKSTDPRWTINDLNVYQDPRSRYFDPTDPDHPPKPTDDPTSGQIMRCIYGKHAMRKWLKDGVTSDVVNPMWMNLLPTYTQVLEDGTIILDIPTANLLGRIHSRDYQRNMEEVYLSSLDVAFERFRFSVQYFGGNTTYFLNNGNEAFAILGRFRQGPQRVSRSLLGTNSNLGFSRTFAAGGQLVASVANSMVWQFSGENSSFATSVVNWSVVQPLLRGGGRIVTLETLTRSERNLLANLRAMGQFRQDFHRQIIVGGGTSVAPARIGGFSGGAGLTGFTGTGSGGFGGVGAGQGFGGTGGQGGGVGSSGAGGQAGLAGGGEGILDGYYGLVQRLQTIRNTEAALASEQLTLGLLEANFAAGLIDIVQVDEFRQNIQTERANLLRATTAFRDNLETYLFNVMDLPPTLKVELDDSLIRQFQLIGPSITATQQNATTIIADIGKLPDVPSAAEQQDLSARLATLAAECQAGVQSARTDFRSLEVERDSQDAAITPTRKEEINQTIATAEINLKVIEERLALALRRSDDVSSASQEDQPRNLSADLVELATDLSGIIQEIGLVQATLRVQKVKVEPIDLAYGQAIEIARANRLDWMNQRSALVDQWRLVRFNANRLLAGLNITASGDLGTIGNNATRFRGTAGDTQINVNFDAPLNRKAERNIYRESLIEYQRQKRSYVQYVDSVALSLRVRLRQINRLAENLEIQRQALAIAIRRVDKTLEDLNQPFPPAKPGEAPPQLGPTLAQNLLRALSDLRNTQDNFMSVWLNYEAARINLAFQLGTLEVGPDGLLNVLPMRQARMNTTPIENLQEQDIPVEAFLRQMDETIAQSGDASKALDQNPDDPLVKKVDASMGETITAADLEKEAGDEKRIEEREQDRPESWREKMMRWWQKSGQGTPITITKSEFPRTIREFKSLKDAGLDDEEISKRTGWDSAAIAALAEVIETSQRPILETIPVRSLPKDSPVPPSDEVQLANHQESSAETPKKSGNETLEKIETLREPAPPNAGGHELGPNPK